MLYMCRYGEMWLKSEPVRKRFAKILKENLSEPLKNAGITANVDVGRDRIFVKTETNASHILSKVFGIVSFSNVHKVPLSKVGEYVLKVAADFGERESFAIRVRREGKHAFSSQEKAAELGSIVVKRYGYTVNLTSPDNIIYVEIRNDECFVFGDIHQGAGGLPTGSEGLVVSEFDGSKEAIVSAYLMLKRGCKVVLIGSGDLNELQHYSGISLHTEIPEKIRKRIIAAVSHSVDNFESTKAYPISGKWKAAELPVLYPLVGMNKKKIDEIYKNI